jgi:hypothetical protein
MMAGPGDEIAAGTAGRGHMRASHADREQVIETLKAAFVQGRLDRDEFDLRVGQTFASRTYADLAARTADIPAGLATAKPPAPARVQGEQPVLRPGRVITATTAVYAGVWAYALVLSPHEDVNPSTAWLIFGGFWVYLIILVICVGYMVASRREKRSGGQSPRRPAAGGGGQASQRVPSADPGRRLPAGGHGHQHTAGAARMRLPRPVLPGSGSLRRWHPRELLAAAVGNRHAMSAQVVKPATP